MLLWAKFLFCLDVDYPERPLISENGSKVCAAVSCAEDRVQPVQSPVLPCRALPHRGAALCGSSRCWQSGFIKVPHCCPSSLRCMWTDIIGRTAAATFKPGRHEKTQEASRKWQAGKHSRISHSSRVFCCVWTTKLGQSASILLFIVLAAMSASS